MPSCDSWTLEYVSKSCLVQSSMLLGTRSSLKLFRGTQTALASGPAQQDTESIPLTGFAVELQAVHWNSLSADPFPPFLTQKASWMAVISTESV